MSAKFRYIESMLKGINNLVGGLPTGSILGLFGIAGAGKSILAFHLIYDRLLETNNDTNAMIFDTEGSEFTYIEWLPILNERTGLDVGLKFVSYDPESLEVTITDDKQKHDKFIYILDMRQITHILGFHGRGCTMTRSKTRDSRDGEVKGGKVKLVGEDDKWFDIIDETPIGKFIDEHKIGILIYDSITNPLTIFGFEQENLPSRTNATNWWLTSIQALAEEKELVCVVTAHETSNPQKAWERPHYEGGKAIEHNMKFVVYISEGKSSRTPKTPKEDTNWSQTTRELRNQRHPSKRPFIEYVKLDLTDTGFIDME